MDSRKSPLVLIVEDDPAIARIIARMLRAAGYRTRTALDAVAAREILAEAQPCLITLDLSLPGISGATFLRQLRATPRIAQPAVVMVTVHQHIRPEVRELADGLISKPFAMEDLIRAVGNALAQNNAPNECATQPPLCIA